MPPRAGAARAAHIRRSAITWRQSRPGSHSSWMRRDCSRERPGPSARRRVREKQDIGCAGCVFFAHCRAIRLATPLPMAMPLIARRLAPEKKTRTLIYRVRNIVDICRTCDLGACGRAGAGYQRLLSLCSPTLSATPCSLSHTVTDRHPRDTDMLMLPTPPHVVVVVVVVVVMAHALARARAGL